MKQKLRHGPKTLTLHILPSCHKNTLNQPQISPLAIPNLNVGAKPRVQGAITKTEKKIWEF